jgi:hypothetical protein
MHMVNVQHQQWATPPWRAGAGVKAAPRYLRRQEAIAVVVQKEQQIHQYENAGVDRSYDRSTPKQAMGEKQKLMKFNREIDRCEVEHGGAIVRWM